VASLGQKGSAGLLENLGQIESLTELVITTNGSQLETMAADLKKAGVKRINISLDTLDAISLKSLPERVIYSRYFGYRSC